MSTDSLVSLSEKHFDDCSKQIRGRNSCLMDHMFTLNKTNAIASESPYSYSACEGIREFSSSDGVTGDYTYVPNALGFTDCHQPKARVRRD